MKNFKILAIILITAAAITIVGCKKCKNEDPSARIINNGTEQASVQIKTSGGKTININNVQPGESSEYASYAPGVVTFTITITGNEYIETVTMVECCKYDITIDSKNNISTTVIDQNDKK